MSRSAAPVGEVTTPMRRGSAGSGALARGLEQSLACELLLQLLEPPAQRAFAGLLQVLDDQLEFAARLVQAHAAAREHRMPSRGGKRTQHDCAAEHRAADLRAVVLEREIPVAGGGAREIRDLALDPERAAGPARAACGPRVQARGEDSRNRQYVPCRRRALGRGSRTPGSVGHGRASILQSRLPRSARRAYNSRVPCSRGSPHAAHPRGSPHLRRRPAGAGLFARCCRTKSASPRSSRARIRLNMPLVSAAMDTVTEAPPRDRDRAGRRHRHRAQEHDHRSAGARSGAREEVRERHHPRPDHRHARKPRSAKCSTSRAPRTSPACRSCRDGKAVGIVTHRDLRFETQLDAPVSTVMTPRERLVTVRENAPKEEVLRAAAQAPHREGAGGRRRLRAEGHDHGQGHPEGDGISARLQGRARRAARRRGGRHRRRHAGARRRRCAKPAST